MAEHDLPLRALHSLARTLGNAGDPDQVINTLVYAAREALPEIDEVGISVTHRDGSIETRAWTGGLVTDLDQLQYEISEGPCVDAIDPNIPADVVRVDNVRHEQRWPNYIPKAAGMGLRAQLGIRLYTEERTVGGLNLYSTTESKISEDTEILAELFATHAALALGRVRTETDLRQAMTTRQLIGQATGIVMQRFQVDSHHAFLYLTRLSQDNNIKLRAVAQTILDEFEQSLK